MSLLTTLIGIVGVQNILPDVEQILLKEVGTKDQATLERIIEPPESVIEEICARTGADVPNALAKRDAFGAAFADFANALANVAVVTKTAGEVATVIAAANSIAAEQTSTPATGGSL